MYGAVVRRARLERGLTQHELAAVAGVEQPNLSAIETGRRQPTADTLHRLLAACGFELVAVAGPRVLAFPAPDDPAADVDDAVLDAHRDIPMATRVRMLNAVLDTAEAIVRSR